MAGPSENRIEGGESKSEWGGVGEGAFKKTTKRHTKRSPISQQMKVVRDSGILFDLVFRLCF